MKVTIIAACGRNRVIGSTEGGIPWHLPRDAAHFRAYCRSKWVLVGRKTFEEMRDWFESETPVVVTKSADFSAAGAHISASVGEAIAWVRQRGTAELVVAGGGQIYQAALPFAEEVLLTQIDANFPGNIYFPALDPGEWLCEREEIWERDEKNPFPMVLQTWVRTSTAI